MVVVRDNGRGGAARVQELEQRVRELLGDLEQAAEIHREDLRKLELAMEFSRAAAAQLEGERREAARLRARIAELEGRLQ